MSGRTGTDEKVLITLSVLKDESCEDLEKILSGSRNIRFEDMTAMVEAFGFRLVRQNGSHHIFSQHGVSELVNLQAVQGQAKPYQVRQFLKIVEKYNLRLSQER